MSCSNNLKQLGLAIHSYHAAFERLPSGWIADEPSDEPSDEPGWSWGAASLPFMEQQAIHEKINFSVAIEDAMHQAIRETAIQTFICRSDMGKDLFMIAESAGGHHHAHSSSSGSGTGTGTATSGNVDDSDPKLFLIAKANYVGVFGTKEIEDDPFNGDGTFYGNSKTR